MSNYRTWFPIIYSASLFTIFGTALLVSELWIHHDSSNLLLHMSLLLNAVVFIAAMIWLGVRWKYFSLAGWILFIVFSGAEIIHRWTIGSISGACMSGAVFLLALFLLKKEIMKLHISIKSEPIKELVAGKR